MSDREEKRRSKRQSHPPTEEGWWDCSMCTYKNPPEFFKCEMCECRKGTSTRKPRVTTQITAQQVAQSVFTPPPPKKERKEKKERREKSERLSIDTSTPDFNRDDSVEGDREEPELPELATDHVSPPIKMKKDIVPQVDTITTTSSSSPLTSKPKKEPSTSKDKTDKDCSHSTKAQRRRPPRLKNIDRNSGQSMEVTVNNVTVIITDYKPKKSDKHSHSAATNNAAGSAENHSSKMNSVTQAALSERDGAESKDSFCSNQTDTLFSGGDGESINGEVSSTVAES